MGPSAVLSPSGLLSRLRPHSPARERNDDPLAFMRDGVPRCAGSLTLPYAAAPSQSQKRHLQIFVSYFLMP